MQSADGLLQPFSVRAKTSTCTCATSARRKACAADRTDAPLVITSSISTMRLPARASDLAAGTAKALRILRKRSASGSWLCVRVWRMRSRLLLHNTACCGWRACCLCADARSALANNKDWLKPRSAKRSGCKGMGIKQSHVRIACIIRGFCTIRSAKREAHPVCAPNLKPSTHCCHGQP